MSTSPREFALIAYFGVVCGFLFRPDFGGAEVLGIVLFAGLWYLIGEVVERWHRGDL